MADDKSIISSRSDEGFDQKLRRRKKMARKSTAILDVSGPQKTPLDAIPDDVKAFVEDVFKRQSKAPGRERVTYDNDQERDTEFKLMADYVSQRPAGILKIRRSPSKDLPPHSMDIRITADVEANGQAKKDK